MKADPENILAKAQNQHRTLRFRWCALASSILMAASLGWGTAAPESATTLDCQRLLNQAVAAHQTEVTFPPGVYRIKSSEAPGSTYHLTIKGASNLVIRGEGATLVFENPRQGGLLFERCHKLTVTGLTLDWAPLPFTQGRITAMSPSEPWYDVQVDAGYSDDASLFDKSNEVFVYDPQTRHLKRGSWELFGVAITRERQGMLRLHFKSVQSMHDSGAAVGDLAVAGIRLKMGIRLMECTEITVDRVTIWTAPGIALQEANGEGGSRYTYTVTPGPAPAGGSARLLSATADAFHSACVRRGPVVEKCLFESQGDDGIAIHGAYSLVTAAGAPGTLRISPKREMLLRAGDQVEVYDGRDCHLKGEARITAVGREEPPTGAAAEAIRAWWKQNRDDLPGKRYFTLTLDHPIEAGLGDLASSSDWNGNGFTVRDNVVRHSRGRGILVKASEGLIVSNRLEDITGSGICLGPEFASWLEGDYVRNVTIRDNHLQDIGIGANCVKNARSIFAGAIMVYAAATNASLPTGMGNRNIVIEGNSVDASGGIGMLIACAQDVQVRSNRIGATRALGTMEGGKRFGVDPYAAIFVTVSARVRFQGNQVGGKGIVIGTNTAEIVK